MADESITPKDEQFASIIAGLFHDMLRAAGIAMSTPQKSHERTREVGRRMGAAIEFRAERKAVEVIRVLQAAIIKAFDGVENEQKALRERIDALEARLNEAAYDGADRGTPTAILPGS